MAYNLLKGKRGIIFGALNDASIAWKVAERASEEGAQIVLTNTPVACRMGTIDELAKKTNATIIPADATSVDDLEKLFVQAQEVMGGKIDFVLHSVAMSVNMRKKRTYDDLDYGFLNKTLDISAISFHKMIQTAKKLDAINENGSILALSYVAAQRTFFGYNDMADAKSLLESIARSFGYIYFSDRMSPLGNASADECADYCVVMFSDLTKKVTMQNLYHDGGFSSMGMSLRGMTQYEKSFIDENRDENGKIIYG